MRNFRILFFLIMASCSKPQENSTELPISSSNPIKVPAPVQSSSVAQDEPEPCPKEMSFVHGLYCTKVEQKCIKWRDNPAQKFARCEKFAPSVCIGEKVPMNFCIDTYEFATNFQEVPVTDISWTHAKALCEANGKQLCSEEEWTFACEGPDMLPYTTGLERPTKLCNMDVEKKTVCGKELCDHRYSVMEFPQCKSPFGVMNMAGNVDEWIEVPNYQHSKTKNLWMRSGLKGGHWLPVRNRCRPITKDHDEGFHQISIGFRCCSKSN